MDRKAMRQAYRDAPPPMGVWAVRNTTDGTMLVGASPNAAGRLNRERFSLETGSHLSRDLQADWNRLGEGAFVFEVLDTLDQPDDPDTDASEDLAELLAMWLDKLALPTEKLYADRG